MDNDGLLTFLSVRPRLFGIVCRMLRSEAEAEDVVQDVWIRWQSADRSIVRNAAAFLTTTATRLAINAIRSARSRHEMRGGPRMREPVDTRADQRSDLEHRQALARGLRLLLDALTPTERAAYILREAFEYPYRDIASALRLKEANARQVVTRARQRIANSRLHLLNQLQRERGVDHETRHHRRQRTHWIQARGVAEEAGS